LITVKDLTALRGLIRQARSSSKTIGFVPTMGALHAGHLSLVQLARRESDYVVVSIFVNPLQFSAGEDFERYPRRVDADSQMLPREGVDLLYTPRAEDFYPPGFSTSIEVSGVSEGGEGGIRHAHFRGVATVVAKLFLHVTPDVVSFGRKDLQQVAVIRKMIRDLDFPIRLVVGETVREPDRLALSSRNVYLSTSERERAALFPKALFAAGDRASAGQTDSRKLETQIRGELEQAGLAVDYVEVVDPETMRPVPEAVPGAAIAAAIRLGKTRLIDNVLIPDRR
jgi:pantoate--beta-alanine ligase